MTAGYAITDEDRVFLSFTNCKLQLWSIDQCGGIPCSLFLTSSNVYGQEENSGHCLTCLRLRKPHIPLKDANNPAGLLSIAEETLAEFLAKATGTAVDWVQMPGMKGQCKNDFEGTDFKNQAHFPWASSDHVLSNVFEINVEQSKWWDLSVLFLMIIIYCLLFFIVIKIHQGSVHQIRESISKCWLQRVPKKIQQA